MGGNKRPSFLKRQKELQRVAKATRKREERRIRKRGGPGVPEDGSFADSDLALLDGMDDGIEVDETEAEDAAPADETGTPSPGAQGPIR